MYVTYTRIYGWSDYGGESSYQPGYRLENMMWMTLLVYDYIIPGRQYGMVWNCSIIAVALKNKAFGNESKTIGEKAERSGIYVKAD